jgi:hypothetical protein
MRRGAFVGRGMLNAQPMRFVAFAINRKYAIYPAT